MVKIGTRDLHIMILGKIRENVRRKGRAFLMAVSEITLMRVK